MSRRKKVLASVTAVALVLGGFATGRAIQAGLLPSASAAGASRPEAQMPATPGFAAPSFASLAERVSGPVVSVKAVSVQKVAEVSPDQDWPQGWFGDGGPFRNFRRPFTPFPQGGLKRQGTGTGFVVREDGLVVTNNHVVEGAKEVTVTLGDGVEYTAKVVGRDPKTDLAVLKIDPKGTLPVVKLGDSGALHVGDWVLAVGNPFGLSKTVTAGIVSAKGRVIGAGPYDDFIQTDASINPGNSGGPLFNERGEVVGINTAIYTENGGNIGIGFALPINLAKSLLPELETKGSVTRGWLGVSIQKVTPDIADSLGLADAEGALVADVTRGSPADSAGIRRGDVITRFDGKKIAESSALPSMVATVSVGKTVAVEVLRNGKLKTIDVKVAKLAESPSGEADETSHGKWGLVLREPTADERDRLGLKPNEGVLVEAVQPGSPAADAGVQSGDAILEVNQRPVASVEQVQEEAARVQGERPLLLLVQHRDQGSRFAALKPK